VSEASLKYLAHTVLLLSPFFQSIFCGMFYSPFQSCRSNNSMIPGTRLVFLIHLLCNVQCLQLLSRSSPSLINRLWIQKEIANVLPLKQHFEHFLTNRNISLASAGPLGPISDKRLPSEVATSSLESPYECRLKFGTVPFGKKVVAPCKCTGTQKVSFPAIYCD
jgi:hypothetical protein